MFDCLITAHCSVFLHTVNHVTSYHVTHHKPDRVSRYGPNILLNSVEGYQRPSLWQCLRGEDSGGDNSGGLSAGLWDFDTSIISGFQLATLSGPMCEEPLMGVCFSIERWDVQSSAPAQNQDVAGDGSISPGEVVDSGVVSRPKEDTTSGLNESKRRPEAALADCYGPVSGQLIAATKEACRQAFQAQPQRLMAAMYTCEIMATAEVLGKKHG